MAGRDISVTHVALGTVRVQGTLATLGQAAGTADFAYGWGNAEPIISSVDGVEVDPIGEAPRPPQRPDDTDDSGR